MINRILLLVWQKVHQQVRETLKGHVVPHWSISMLNCSNYAGNAGVIGVGGMYWWPCSKTANKVGVGEVMQP